MAVTLTLTGKTPSQSQFGLDAFTEHYKCDATADVVLTDSSVPARGDAHPDYATMFLTDRHCQETGESASALDLTYQGTFTEDLPPQQHQVGIAIQTGSSSWGSAGATIGTVNIQFYAPQHTLTYMSFGGVGTDEADDPSEDIVIITVTANNANFAPGTTPAILATSYFTEQIVHSLESTEIVAGQYWQNVSRKTKVLVPYIVTVPAGTALLALGSAGTGYRVGDTLTISASGETAVVVISALGPAGSISQFNVLSNTFTVTQNLLVPSGGGGTGALFNVIIV